MRYRQLAVTIVLAVFGPFAAAQDLLECVDPDVRAGLLGSAFTGAQRFTSEPPDIIADLVVPAELEFIGTAESDLVTTTAFKSDLAPDAALDALVVALAVDDWQPLREFSGGATGFIVGPRPAAMMMLCRDADMLNARSSRRDGATYVNLNTVMRGGGICAQGGAAAAIRPPGVDLSRFMPRLEMPGDGRQDRQGASLAGVTGGSTSGGRRSMTTNVQLVTTRDAASLAGFFADQLRAQDWQIDVDWSGRTAAGSAWTASRMDEETGRPIELAGLLDVAVTGANRYDAQFRLTRLED